MTLKNHTDNIILVELPAEPGIRQELDKTMEIVRENSDHDVLVDFSIVNIMTSMTLSGFLKLRKLLDITNRRLIFFNTSRITRDIFRVTCLDAVFEYAEDLESAQQMLKATPTPAPIESQTPANN